MKNLANCTPREFLSQTNRIRKSVSKWLTDTDVMNIRRRLPKLPDDITEEEKQAMLKKQASANVNAMLDAILEDHPDETLELLALLCFVEPEDVDNYPMTDYLDAVSDLISNKSVIDFFTSLMRLEQMDI